jgi:hypothetical protein
VARRATQSGRAPIATRLVRLARRDGSLRLPDRRLGPQRGADFLLRRPPVRALNLGDTLAHDIGRRLHIVEAPGVGAQKESALALWYRARTADSRSGTRKTMVVALARKLIIALWRFVTTGEPLEGVVLRPAS